MDDKFYDRFITSQLLEALKDTPVVLIHGSRQCGKTTLAQDLGRKRGYDYISFDDRNQLSAAQADPIGFVSALGDRTILDEIQRVPTLFTAIKAKVDKGREPGQFILTGSSNILLLPNLADSLAGRMEVIHLRPLANMELTGNRVALLECLFSADKLPDFNVQQSEPLGMKLADLIVSGGYPAALARSSVRRRTTWYYEYINTIVQRDIQDIANIRNAHIVPQLLSLCASQTARLFNVSDIASPFALSRPTIQNYLAALEQLFLIEQLQPWFTNRLSRLVKTPKMHVSDTGLACALLGINSDQLWHDRPLYGQLLETFVHQELRKLGSWFEQPLHFFHFRNKDKVEVDVVIEQGKRLLGVEIKASSTVGTNDFKGLIKLQEGWKASFFTGVVFYDGNKVLSFGKRLFAIPLGVLASPI